MTTAPSFPVVGYWLDQFGAWLKQRRQLNELSALDQQEFSRMAHELGLAPGDLQALVERGAEGAAELPEMLRALGFDDHFIDRIATPRLMELRHACAGCAHKHACHVDLAAKTAAVNYENYCANANDITLMRAERDRAAENSMTSPKMLERRLQ